MDCPPGWYEQSLDYSCQKCHDSCQTCEKNATDCPDCRNVTGIIYYNLDSTSCLVRCPNGYYGFDANNTCVLCHEYCSRCFGPDEFSCTACRTHNGTAYHLIFGSNTCNETCPEGEYANSTSHLCLVCDSNCATCFGTARNCTSCFLVNGFYVYLHGSICIQECPAGQYEDSTTRECELCAEGCATCTGKTLYDCQTCDNETTFNYTNNLATNYTYYKVIN